ncbi:MAG: hypothetical protein Q4E11_02685 [Corynebacterium sp.]|uniref:hypothetical protein n=1 Tax=Corynebacterium sp. TaxID=1720 RepID=UPI0026DC7050|nr:hypothetical protein [Corynebacterium sp.]MDO5029474.1 hypothetical protein [Corynebacterium sp.]
MASATQRTFGDEPHWGDPTRPQPRESFHKGEISGALAWLSVAALVSLIIEVVFLGVWITVGSVAIPFPWTIVLAYVMNLIITNTALLWTRDRSKAAIPVVVWVIGFAALLVWSVVPAGGDLAMGQWLRTILLLAAGLFGGAWPLRHQRAL